MKDEERDLLKRLAPGPAPKPPAGLLEKLKADIPERLPSNVRPFRPRTTGTVLRIAATLFVAGGALFVLTHVRREALSPDVGGVVAPSAPAPPPAPSKLDRNAASPPSVSTYPSERPAAAEAAADKATDKATEAAPAAPKRQAAPEGDIGEAKKEKKDRAAKPEVARKAEEARTDVDAFAPPMPAAPKAAAAPPAAQALADQGAASEPQAARAAGGLRALQAREEKPASLLGEVLGGAVRPAAARDEGQTFVLLSLAGAPRGALAGGTVLTEAALPGGGCVVLAEAHAPVVTLRSGAESVTVRTAEAAASLADAPAELRLAVLAWRLERARARGDAGERARVAAEAEALSPGDPRAARLKSAARP